MTCNSHIECPFIRENMTNYKTVVLINANQQTPAAKMLNSVICFKLIKPINMAFLADTDSIKLVCKFI